MASEIISVRLSASIDAELRVSAARARLSVSGAVEWLLRNSIGNFELLRGLPDCIEPLTSKIDARITEYSLEQLKLASQRLGISISVYARRLLYHFYATKRLFYVESDGRYTLAVRRSSVYSYLFRLHRQGLLNRGQIDGRLVYTISDRGIERLNYFDSQKDKQ
jgi:hypothetical protein